jgi:hypothetical protein
MRGLGVCAVTGIAAILVSLGGCQFVGPNAIGQGRERYNSVLQSTAMEQTMSNIVRVYQHEPTLFMDVTEVDATLSVGGSLSGGSTNIGATAGKGTSAGTLAGQVYSANGTVQYSETPTIRYQPLLGQALVAQLVTPVSIDALGLLYDSGWPAATLLDLASAYLTLDYDEFYSAFNTIIELDNIGALELAAAKSKLQKPADLEKADKSGSASPNDSLIIYLRPFSAHAGSNNLGDERRVLQLWVRLLRIYAGTQPVFSPRDANCARLNLSAGNPEQLKDWDVGIGARTRDQLDAARNCLPSRIELRVVPAMGPGGDKSPEFATTNLISGAPLMRTYSALGILKTATERPHPKIEFVTPERYLQIRDPATHPWNDDPDSLSYYTLLPEDEDSIDCPDAVRKQKGGCDNPSPGGPNSDAFSRLNNDVAHWIAGSATPEPAAGEDTYHGGFVYEERRHDLLEDRYLRMNQRLGSLRRYMLIVVDGILPPDKPYVAYSYNGRWYYIAGDDTVSKKNFHLLSLFMTIMAVPQTNPPLAPVINVGG